MKKIKRVTVVEGNPSEVRNEILLKKNNATGKIDLLKRDSSGILKSIMDNNVVDFLAHPEKDITPIINPSTGESHEFVSAFENLSNAILSSSTLVQPHENIMEAVVELTEQVQHDIDTIAAYLPSMKDDGYILKIPNVINVSGVVWIDNEDPSHNYISTHLSPQILTITFPSENQVKLQLVSASI